MKKKVLFLLAMVSLSFGACDYDDVIEELNYASFGARSAAVGVDIGGTATHEISVFTGNVVSSDRTFDVAVNPNSTLAAGAYTVPATVTIPGGSNEGVISIEVSDQNLGPNGETLILGLVPESGFSVGAPITVTVSQICPYTEFNLSFAFDDYASETSWEVKDASGAVVFEGGPYEDGDSSLSRNLCLPAGDYSFTVYDSFGDGIVGSVTLTYGGVEIAKIEGDFGDDETVSFTLE